MTSGNIKRGNGVSSENTLRHSNRTPKTEEKRGNGVSSKKKKQPQNLGEKARVDQARQLIILYLKYINEWYSRELKNIWSIKVLDRNLVGCRMYGVKK